MWCWTHIWRQLVMHSVLAASSGPAMHHICHAVCCAPCMQLTSCHFPSSCMFNQAICQCADHCCWFLFLHMPCRPLQAGRRCEAQMLVQQEAP